MRIYFRTTPIPNCRTCGKRMGYWVPGLPDSEHEHPECAGRRWAKEAMEKFNKNDAALQPDGR